MRGSRDIRLDAVHSGIPGSSSIPFQCRLLLPTPRVTVLRNRAAIGRALCAILLIWQALPAVAAGPHWTDISGYRVDMRQAPEAQLSETEANLLHQISIVESAKVPDRIKSFFRRIHIVIDPTLTGMNGQYTEIKGEWMVRARPGKWPPDRAILLHELLHAYHREVLGQPTPPIGRAFEEALRDGTYPPEYKTAYFLSNPREYFAVVGEIYLSGPSFRPPFSCGIVKNAQPGFIRYLESLFGEQECQ